jgi:branched-chain amino acid transport system substrate-binding protein
MDSTDRQAACGRGKTLRIGVGAPLSGPARALGQEMVRAIELAVDEARLARGIAGMPVDLSVADDRGDEREGLRIARAFAEDRDLSCVIGHYNSNVTLAAASVYHEAELPLVAPIVSNPRLTQQHHHNVFRFTNRDDATAEAMARYLVAERGKSRAVVAATRTTYGLSMADEFARAFLRAGGRVVGRVDFEEGEHQFADVVRGLPAEMDFLFYGGTFEGAPLLKALREQGRGQLFAAGDGCWDVPNFLIPAGTAAMEGEAVLVLSACPEVGHVAGSSEFAERYRARFGPIVNYAVNAYDSAQLVLQALLTAARTVGAAPDRAAVLKALREQRYQGIAYPETVCWDRNGDNQAAVTALHVIQGEHFVQIAER